mmetsp:Transcript_7089/g.12869  ORF Transcript_7089/g.12869 Transcript_7089/m.12869 type:complete len:101 (-) Transcript_7089:3154-3456(-)
MESRRCSVGEAACRSDITPPLESEGADAPAACYARDAGLLMSCVLDMVERDYDMQMAAWADTRLETPPDQLQTYGRLSALQPFLDDTAVGEVSKWAACVQ